MAKATIEALLARKDKGALTTKEVYVPALDMDVVVEKKPLSVVAGFFDEMRTDMRFSKSIDVYKELIYACVPIFHDKRLQDAYSPVEPYDIVPAIFDDNVMAIQALGNEILSMYGFDEIIQNVKN